MLGLINEEREKAGVGVVVLGDNRAPQIHAENALEGCFTGHWGLDGTKPYMRYSLAGGYQSSNENALGNHFCIPASGRFAANKDIETEIVEAMDSWMGSFGHRRNILNPRHKKVSIGLAWDRYNVRFYQNFEGDYVQYSVIPSIKDGVLSLEGTGKNGVRFAEDRDLGVSISYDQTPTPLTRGQLSEAHCVGLGLPVVSLRWPVSRGYRWADHSFERSVHRCQHPSSIDPDTKPPIPTAFPVKPVPMPARPVSVEVPWITAQKWVASGSQFAVKADIGSVLGRHGPGVYKVVVWGPVGGASTFISQYPIFHGVEPPSGYGD